MIEGTPTGKVPGISEAGTYNPKTRKVEEEAQQKKKPAGGQPTFEQRLRTADIVQQVRKLKK